MRNQVNLKMELCEGRHEIPQAIDGAIFKEEISSRLMKYEGGLEGKAYGAILYAAKKYGGAIYGETEDGTEGLEQDYFTDINLDLYVTGLTVALVSVINVCHKYGNINLR